MTNKTVHASCEQLLLDYAAGTLDEAHSLVVAAYLTLSPSGRRYVDECEALGGALIEHLCDPVAISAECRSALLAKISCNDGASTEGRAPCCNETSFSCNAPLPAPLARLMPPGISKEPRWKGTPGGGLRWMDIPVSDRRSRVRMIRLAPGFTLPHHRHTETELMLVLEGAFFDGGDRFARGDLVMMDAGCAHETVADAEAGCLCVGVTGGEIRFTGFLSNLLNRVR